jgi:hypothetical protein
MRFAPWSIRLALMVAGAACSGAERDSSGDATSPATLETPPQTGTAATPARDSSVVGGTVPDSRMTGMDHGAHVGGEDRGTAMEHAPGGTGARAGASHGSRAHGTQATRHAASGSEAPGAVHHAGGSGAMDHGSTHRTGARTSQHGEHAAARAAGHRGAGEAESGAGGHEGSAQVAGEGHRSAVHPASTAVANGHLSHRRDPAPTSADADGKLLQLAERLLQDSAVRERVQADPELRRRWNDPAVRRVLTTPR